MKCPNDGETLVMSERSGIEIDYCPQCRGVWLDRGELDKLIEKNSTAVTASSPPQQQPHQVHHDRRHEPEYRYSEDRYYKDDYRGKRHKKESFLGNVFDF